MRWPYRQPHAMTPGMRVEQRSLAAFMPFIRWQNFSRQPVDIEVENCAAFGCASADQAVVYLLRRDINGTDGMLRRDAEPLITRVDVPGLDAGSYLVTAWETRSGKAVAQICVQHEGGSPLSFEAPPIATDMAFAIREVGR
jgi:hypothetical protein